MLSLQSGATTVEVQDDVGLDSNPTAGAVTFIGPIASFQSVVATCVSKPVVGDANLATLNTTVVSLAGSSPASLTFRCTDTDYFPGSSGGDATFTTEVGGTTAGTTSFQSFVDTANTEFGTWGPTVCASPVQGPFGPGAFDDTVATPCQLSGPMSMTIEANVLVGAYGTQSFGTSTHAPRPEEALGCRFTGGGVDTDFNWNHTLESGKMVRNGAGNLPDEIDRYQFGGQAGARTGQAPIPSGEWQHHQQTGPSGQFSFHGGSSSAARGTWIAEIRCSDPGFCFPARPAPAKQLNFDGVGTFSNLGHGVNEPVFQIADPNVIAEPAGKKKGATFTFHWFEVNIDDLGEPGRLNSGAPNSDACPGRGFGEKSAGPFVPDPVDDPGATIILPSTPLANCDCPDFYRITIYRGVLSTEVTFLANGKVDPASMNRADVIYEVYGYVDGGNLQIHPPTGYDLK